MVTMFPEWSKTMKRVLVVPWSIAATYFGIRHLFLLSLIRPSATFSQHMLGEGWDEGQEW
jgi:hypothetical protein